MANKEITPDSLARQLFIVTLLGALLYIGVVFTFIIGGNRREEEAAAKQAQAEQGAGQPGAEQVTTHQVGHQVEHQAGQP